MTEREAEDWGRGDTRRITTAEFPAEVKELVDRKQGGRFCLLCREDGLVTPAEEPLVLDHLRPLSQGGDNHWTNLRWLCAGHNRRRQARPLWRGTPPWALRRERRPS